MIFSKKPESGVIVSTQTNSIFNQDGQHDCAGTWALVRGAAGKNERNQILAAEGIKYLIHRRDNEVVSAYAVVGYHSERRDGIARKLTQEDLLNHAPAKISIGIRFHLRPLPEAVEKDLIEKAKADLANRPWNVEGCRVIEL